MSRAPLTDDLIARLRLVFTNEVIRAIGALARQQNVCREQAGQAVFVTGMEAAREYIVEQLACPGEAAEALAAASRPEEQERDWKRAYHEESRIVDNVWAALGISTYEQAEGKDLATLVSERCHAVAQKQTAGDLLLAVIDSGAQHALTCEADPCSACDVSFEQFHLAYEVWKSSANQRSSASPAAPPPWQPISTAPKDGTWFWVKRENPPLSSHFSESIFKWDDWYGGWFGGTGWYGKDQLGTMRFTHWRVLVDQPLPSPPASAPQPQREEYWERCALKYRHAGAHVFKDTALGSPIGPEDCPVTQRMAITPAPQEEQP